MRPWHLLGLALILTASPANAAQADRLKELSDKLDANTLSADETREILRVLMRQALDAQPAAAEKPSASQAAAGGEKVIAVYPDRNTTQLVIEARRPLVAGTLVYAGPEELQVTLDDLMARSGDLYYYSASTPGKARIQTNDAVVTQRTRKLDTPSALQLKIQETYTFEQKRVGEVTAVQNGRAMIDRGTLHEVRERDIYKVFDATGAYKGFLEIRGIGDLQSSGVLYNRMEDRRRLALKIVPGDRVIFLGQRKLLALGALGGIPFQFREEFGSPERAIGGGLAWDLMFKNGWGVELLFGAFQRRLSAAKDVTKSFNNQDLESITWTVNYYAPFVVKKNFFFPSVASPFLVAGCTVVDASLRLREFHSSFSVGPGLQTTEFIHNDSKTTIAPVLGVGVDFFPARLIRPRLEVRWIAGPTLRAGYKTLNTETVLGSFALFTAW